MKAKIFSLKKQYRKKIAIAAAAVLFATGGGNIVMPVQAAESSYSEIFHHHTGDEAAGGGCYNEPVYHQHSGNETEGGTCFETPVYHVHQGDKVGGGGCYGSVVYHTHSGNSSSGGACYSAVKHSHTSNCNVTRECKITYEAKNVFKTWYDTCYHHQETVYGEANAVANHSSCGAGKVETTTWYCLSCGPYASSHTYEVVGCGISTSTITGYRMSCGKSTDTPESYELDCGKDEQVVDAYTLSCEKTEDSIDAYRVSCGMEEGTPLARLVVTNETEGAQRAVKLNASIVDLSGGKADLSNGTYCWYDENGNIIGQQAAITVSQNGNYRLEFIPYGNSSGLSCGIQVDNVYIPTPEPVQTPVQSTVQSEEKDTAKEQQKHEAGNTSDAGNAGEETGQKNTSLPSVSPSSSATPSHTPNILSSGLKGGVSGMIARLWDSSDRKEEAEAVLTPTPTITPVLKVTSSENVSDEPEEKHEAEEKPEVLGEERKEESTWFYEFKGFMKKPAVRIITLTTGTLISAALLGVILFFLRRTVRVYNDDGTGKMIYLGRCIIMDEEDNFSITITQKMEEKACTNRYCMKPGLFRLGRREDLELIVYKEQKRISVFLSKEMIVVI